MGDEEENSETPGMQLMGNQESTADAYIDIDVRSKSQKTKAKSQFSRAKHYLWEIMLGSRTPDLIFNNHSKIACRVDEGKRH